MKITFELKVYTDETKTEVLSVITEEKEFPATDHWKNDDIGNFLDEEYEIWLNKRTDGGWKA